MKNLEKLACLFAILTMTSLPALAIDSTDLKISGRFEPTAICVPTFSNGGVVDYGAISASDLKVNDYTILDARQLSFSISCSQSNTIGLNIYAGRPDTLVTDYDQDSAGPGFGFAPVTLLGVSRLPDRYATGIGLDTSGNKIGGMAMNIKQGVTTINGGVDVDILVGRTRGFEKKDDGVLLFRPPSPPSDSNLSWGMPSTLTPVPLTTLNSKIEVQAYLNKAEALDLTKVINIDGSVTFELVYL